MSAFKDIDFSNAGLSYLDMGENYLVSCNFTGAKGIKLADFMGNTLQDVTLPNGEVIDKNICDW
ncbi:hypothetical protein RIVM261_009790 [Rivularia sp. IAM M-261]|nr:hypothetical protein CAL7716_068440 [Calothrix sp. PCC 7716]GJD16023.1 hypothetical protein RIVM261_009790 [Rivularia sp. IAM M-261]